MSALEPPAVLTGTYVVAYAEVDDSITFVQRKTLSVDGDWLGRVPHLAICQDFETAEFMLQFCDEAWDTIGIACGFQSIEEAKARVEHSYLGIDARWCDSTTSKQEAFAQHQAALKTDSCSFCGRTPQEVDMMFGAEARICNLCIRGFHETLKD